MARMKEKYLMDSLNTRTFDTLINVGLCTSISHSQDTPRRVDATQFFGADVDKPSTLSEVSCVMSSMEQWLPIAGLPDGYYVSSKGRIRSTAKTASGIILKSRLCYNGYETLSITVKGRSTTYLVHRLVAIAFCPNPGNKEEVNHKDFVTTNNSADNLEWVTKGENRQYTISHGRRIGATTETAMSRERNTIGQFIKRQTA